MSETVLPAPEIPSGAGDPSRVAAPSAVDHVAGPSQSPARFAIVLIVHLVRREIAQSNRFSMIGAGWPLLRQLAQLAILVVAFSAVLDLGIPDYPVFVFCGLLGWSWFVTGLGTAVDSIQAGRQLAMRPGFPTIVLPVVATIVPFVDVLFALPILLAMLIATGELHATAPLLLPLLLLQGVLLVGLSWIFGSLAVFFRDVPNLVNVVLLMSFYLTPVYFDVGRVPERYAWVLRLNPMAVLLEADRAVLFGTAFPPAGSFIGLVVVSLALLGVGFTLFRKLAPSFADEL